MDNDNLKADFDTPKCPICGSPVVDGQCQDYGDNNCGYTTE